MAPRPVALPFLPDEERFDPALYYYQLPFSAEAVSELDVFFSDQMETHAVGRAGVTNGERTLSPWVARMIWTLILVLLIVLLVATFPVYPYSRSWGYYPTSVLALLLIVFFVLVWLGYVALWYPWAPVDIEPAREGSPIIETPAAD